MFLSASFQSLPFSQSWSSWFNFLDADGEKLVSLATSCTAGEAMHSLTTLPFPCERDSWPDSSTLHSTTLRKEWCWQNQVIPLTHSNASKFTFFFFQWNAGTFLEIWTSTKAFLSIDICLSPWSLLSDHGWEGMELVHRLLPVPQPVLRSACLLPNARLGESPSRSLAYGAGLHDPYKGIFVLGWM